LSRSKPKPKPKPKRTRHSNDPRGAVLNPGDHGAAGRHGPFARFAAARDDRRTPGARHFLPRRTGPPVTLSAEARVGQKVEQPDGSSEIQVALFLGRDVRVVVTHAGSTSFPRFNHAIRSAPAAVACSSLSAATVGDRALRCSFRVPASGSAADRWSGCLRAAPWRPKRCCAERLGPWPGTPTLDK
jgi:hypothetical protein